MANKNAGKNGIKTRFNGNERQKAASDAGKKSGESRSGHIVARFRRIGQEEISDDDIRDMFKALKTKGKDGDPRAFELIRDTLGEKPTDTMEISGGEPFSVEIRVIE